MTFQSGSAGPLYRANVHPRVLLGPSDLRALKRRIRSGAARAIMQGLRCQVGPLAQQILACKDLPAAIAGRKLAVSWNCGKAIFPIDSIAMVGLLDDDPACIEAVRQFLLAMPEADQTQHSKSGQISGGISIHVPLGYDLIASRVPSAALRDYTDWAVAHCVRRMLDHERTHYYKGAGQNIRLMSMCAVALTGVLAMRGDPGVPRLESELRELIRFLEATLHTSLGPQGYPVEDIGYGTSVLPALAFAVEAVRRAGWYDAWAACPRYSRFGRAILHFVQPWGGYLANTGDCTGMFPNRGFILARFAAETRDPSLLWLLATLGHPERPPIAHDSTWFKDVRLPNGINIPCEWSSLLVLDELKNAAPPACGRIPTAFKDDTRGIVSFRNGWQPDDTFVVFDGGQYSPSVQGHAHASGGHFSISALGEYFAIDTGRYCNEQDQHNVVLVDGKSGRSLNEEWCMTFHYSNLIEYQTDDFCDFAAADTSHLHDCYWARRYLGFVKGEIPLGRGIKAPSAPAYVWTVEDINKANDYREFWWTLNTHPGNKIQLHPDHATIRGCRHGHLLDVHFALPDPSSYSKPHRLSIGQDVGHCGAIKYMADMKASAKRYTHPNGDYPPEHPVLVRPRLVGKVSGYNGRFMSVMIPRRKNEKPAKVTRLPSIDNSLAVQIEFPTVTDTLIFAYEHNLLEAGDVKARGPWCVVRRSRKTGKVLQSALGGGGTHLAVAGKPIHAALSP